MYVYDTGEGIALSNLNFRYILYKLLSKTSLIKLGKLYYKYFEKKWNNQLTNLLNNNKYDLIISDFFFDFSNLSSNPSQQNFKLLYYGGISSSYAKGVIENELVRNHLFSSNLLRTFKKLSIGEEQIQQFDKVVFASKFAASTFLHNDKSIVPLACNIPSDSEYFVKRKDSTGFNVLNCLFVGRLDYLKGITYLLEAFSLLSDEYYLTLVGHDFININNLIMKFGVGNKVKYVGYKQGSLLADLYYTNDILVFPSLLDGYGMVLNEALAYGLPVITTSKVGSSSLINQMENGIVIENLEVKSLMESILWFHDNYSRMNEFRFKARISAKSNQWIRFEEDFSLFLDNVL